MQYILLFLSFAVLSTGIGFISVARSIAEIKAAHAVNPAKETVREKRNFDCSSSIKLL